MIITEVRATTCSIPLTTPIVMGELRFDAREYIVVEVVTDEGLTGVGFGMTRNGPVAPIVNRNLAPLLLGADPRNSERLWQTMYDRNLTIGQRGVFMRALSAVDIALWDIKGQAAGLPLWQMFGGYRDRVAVSIAGGYPRSGLSSESLGTEIADYVTEGYQWIKIAAGPLEDDTLRLQVCAEAIAGSPSLLAYDAHWAWRTLAEVLPTVRGWADLGIAFIEDPYPAELTNVAVQLRERTGISLALGEDTTGRYAYRDLLEQATPEYLRVDATTTGGLSEALKVCAMAATASIPILPHIFPEVHIQLAAAFPGVMAVEATDPRQEIDVLYRLLQDPLRPSGGWADAPTASGLGVTLDQAALQRYTIGREVSRA